MKRVLRSVAVALLVPLLWTWEAMLPSLLWLRTKYLFVVTFGAWRWLGEFVLDQADELDEAKKRHDRLEWRVDELMRAMEQQGLITIPGSIDAPRLTTFGVGLDEIEEAERMRESLETYKKEEAEKAAQEVAKVQGQEPPSGAS